VKPSGFARQERSFENYLSALKKFNSSLNIETRRPSELPIQPSSNPMSLSKPPIRNASKSNIQRKYNNQPSHLQSDSNHTH